MKAKFNKENKFMWSVLPEFEPYRKLLLLQYYFGLRPFELTDARFDGDFLIALNAKHKTSDVIRCIRKSLFLNKLENIST